MTATTCDGVAMDFVRLVGADSASHGAGKRKLWALSGPLFACSACGQAATVLAGTTGECAALASVRLVGVGYGSHCTSCHDR
jgi:hypothetical protein